MGRTFLFLVWCFLMMGAQTWASSPWTAATRLVMVQKAKQCARSPHRSTTEFQAFIAIEDPAVLRSLERHGVKVNSVMNGFVTATIPADALGLLASVPSLKSISLARRLHLCNDSARLLSNVNPVQLGTALAAPLNGEGVIVGVIDVGIDFNHINLLGSDGRSRVCAVYLPCDSLGVPPVVQGDTLPGSCYETPDQIAALTSDYFGSSHGTHTTGTAAGGYMGNGYYGVATGAAIVACGVPSDQLTDVNVANGVRYIFDYADRVGKPCVINLSIGSNDGPNDGTSFLCRTFEALTGPGRICVLAAGNDGNAPIRFSHSLTGVGDTVTTLLRNQWGGLQREGYVSMWSDGPQIHLSRVVIVNRATGELEYASPVMGMLPEDSVYVLSSENDEAFAAYYTGELDYVSALEPQLTAEDIASAPERFHSYWLLDAVSVQKGHLLGLQYLSDEAIELKGWSTKATYFYTYGLEGITPGTWSGSISDLATTDSVISVGAYCSRQTIVNSEGQPYTFSDCFPLDMAYFSSYGPDERGKTRPDLCAPGYSLISSANRFDEMANRSRWPAPEVVDGVEYPYYANQGTSMSTPVVTGAIALMLQLNPSLTPSDIRGIFGASCLRDSYVENGDAERWGLGKLDVAAAIDKVLERTMQRGDVNNDGEINIADVMEVINIILAGGNNIPAATRIRADVNRDREILLSDLNLIIDLIIH